MARPQCSHQFAHKLRRINALEQALQHTLLQTGGGLGPVAAHGLQSHHHQASAVLRLPARIALLASAPAAAQARQKKVLENALQLQLQTRLDPVFAADALGHGLLCALAQALGGCTQRAGVLNLGELHKNRVGVAIQDGNLFGLECLAGPVQRLLAEAGNGVGNLRIEEAAGACAQHAEQRIHHNLDGVIGVAVAPRPRLFAALGQPFEHAGQNGILARKARAVGRGNGVFRAVGLRGAGAGKGIQVKGADQAGIQALEIEHGHMAVQSGLRIEQRAAPHMRLFARGVHRGRHNSAPPQLGQVEQVKGCDAGAHPVELHSAEAAALHAQIEQPLVLENLQGQPRVLQVVFGQGLGRFAPHAHNFLRRIGRVFGNLLAAAEQPLRHGLQAVIGEPQRVAHQWNAVHHHAPGHIGAALPHEAALALQNAGPIPRAAQVALHAQRVAARKEHAQIEVNHIPADDQIRIQAADALQQAENQPRLLRVRNGAGHFALCQQMHFLHSAAHQGGAQNAPGVGGGLEIEGERAQRHPRRSGGERGVVEVHNAVRVDLVPAQFAAPFNFAGGANAAVNQKAVGEAQIGFQGLAPRGGNALAQRRHLCRLLRFDAQQPAPAQVAQLRLCDFDAARALQRPRAFPGGKEVGAEAVVLDQKGRAGFEPPVELHHRDACAHPVGRVDDEAAGHAPRPSLRPLRPPGPAPAAAPRTGTSR